MKLVKDNLYVYAILCSAILLSSCNQSGDTITELEGVWRSICVNGYYEFNGETHLFSGYQILTFNKTTFLRTGYSFTEWNCDDSQRPVITDEVSSIFVGDQVTTINGLYVKEIDFIYEDRDFLDIYYLLDNKSTLFFGKTHGDHFTIGERPKEIDFYVQFNKQ
jgi:hypothetical protein